MGKIAGAFKPALLFLCLIICGLEAQTLGPHVPPPRFKDQKTAPIQQQIPAHMVQMSDFFIRPEAAGPAALRETQAADQPYRPIRVLAMSPDYKGEVGLLKDRDSVASRFGAILEPDTFEELLEQLRTIGKGGRIEQLVFIGHGSPDGGGGRLGFAGDVTASELTIKAAAAQRAGDSRLLDAFSQDAEVIFYNCYVGRDPQFLQSAARLFLAFSGGTVYGSSEAVASSASTINNLLFIADYWMPFLGLGEGVNFRSPSTVDYHKFKNSSLAPLLQRALQPEPVRIEGVREIEPLHRAPLQAIVPERFTNAFFGPFVKFKWSRRDGPRWRPAAEGREVALEVDPNNAAKLALGKNELELRVFLDNGLGARLLGFAPWTITVGASQPADKPPVDAKKPGDKTPGEKPPAAIRLDTPPGGESPSSGTAAGGYWKLTDVKDRTIPDGWFPKSREPKTELWSPKNVVPTVSFAGASVNSQVKGEYDVEIKNDKNMYVHIRQDPFSFQSGLSWSELPKTIAPGVDVSTTLRLSLLPANINNEHISGWMSVSYRNFDIIVNAQTPQKTAQWRLDRPLPIQLSIAEEKKEQVIMQISVIHGGVGGEGRRDYTYTWTAGAVAATPLSSLEVNIAIDKPTIATGETALLKATATGGTPPFTFAWIGPVKGAAAQLAFIADKPGKQDFTVTVGDSKGATATTSASVTVEAPTVTIRRTTAGSVVLGLPYSFQAQLSAAGKPLPGAFVYRWEPHPAVTYAPHEGAAMQTTAVFTRPGPTLVWVDVLRQEGPVLVTVAESEQIELDVVSPELSLAANPSTPFTGQEVRINVTMNPAIQDKYVTFWWEIQGNALNAAPVVVGDAYSRAYTYMPKDTAPVTVTVHCKSKDGGDDLGQKSIVVTAKLYEVKISEPRMMGPPPRVWSEQAKGLVEVPRGIGTFQEFFVNASISPAPPDSPLRYEWKSLPEGCSIYSPGSQETRSSAGQAGTFSISATIRDGQNIVLGSGARTVSIVAPAPEPKITELASPASKTAEALAKLKEASALAADGKLDEAITVTEQAAALDPNSKPISSYLQQLKEAKAQASNLQQQNKPAAPSPTAPPQSKADEAAAKVKQAGVLFQQNKIAEALALSEEALRLDPINQEAGRYVQACRNILLADQKLKQARDLNSQSKTDEALALSEEALRLDPDSTLAVTYIRLLQASKHNKQAVNLAKEGRLEEAAAEIAEAKKLAPSEANILTNEQWIQGLIKQQDANKAIAEKNKAETASLQAANQAADQAKKAAQAKLQAAIQEAAQHLDKAQSLINDGRLDEADAEIAAARKVYPSHWKIPEVERSIAQLRQQQAAANAAAKAKIAEQTNQQAAIQAATQHLDKALSLGKSGQIDEAAAEVAEAKKVGPSHSKIPDFERWIAQLRQQRDAANAAAEAKQAETANQQAAARAAAQKAAEDRAAEARARGNAARAAAEEKKRQSPAGLAGTQWAGEARFTNSEGATASWPLSISIGGTGQISGEMTLTFPGVEGSQKLELQGTYDSGSSAFKMTGIGREEGAGMQLTLTGAATSVALAEGKMTVILQLQGFPDETFSGTWRISKK